MCLECELKFTKSMNRSKRHCRLQNEAFINLSSLRHKPDMNFSHFSAFLCGTIINHTAHIIDICNRTFTACEESSEFAAPPIDKMSSHRDRRWEQRTELIGLTWKCSPSTSLWIYLHTHLKFLHAAMMLYQYDMVQRSSIKLYLKYLQLMYSTVSLSFLQHG